MNATMQTAAPVVDEDAVQAFIESSADADIAEVVAASVETAFARLAENGIAAKAVEGTTEATIAEAVEQAGDANIPDSWINEISNTVKKAIIRELIARLITNEPDPDDSVEAVAVVEPEAEAEDDDNDNDDDDDGFSFGGFAGLDLKYIDAKAQPDEYAALLEQERNGEIRIVTRYRKSFESRLVQSQGNVQDYYNAIKNALLGHKGIKNRVSWNYEAFNRGRAHVAKINAKTKTLYLYLALDPAELADTKYGIIDVSSKKKYASVPVLMKIKGERKFKYALELIEKLCAEKMELPKLDAAEVDYRLPYQTVEEMVESGLLKMLVAGVPVSYFEEQEADAAAAQAENTEA
jgi:predicted transport protein